ncbi:MAG: hypothetical protein M3217_08120 [Actinomycetota bacterium]|nr:hypothetical protein [Actinomycetota bacterium]
MTRLKRLAAATAVAGLVTALVPNAAGAVKKQTVAPAVLGADNLVTGSSTATTVVTIPHDARFNGKTGDNPYFRFSGGGRFIGVLLARVGTGLTPDGVSLLVGRYGFCGSPGCTPAETTQFLALRGTGTEPVLPAGDYRLYLITEAPGSVRMLFDGLRGKVKVVPDVPVDAEVTEPQTGISVPLNLAYSYGRTYDFKGVQGFTFKVLRIEGDSWVAGRYGSCIYADEPLVPPQLAYSAPGCPGGLNLAEIDGTSRTSPFRIDKYSATVFDPGKWTVSSFYEAAGAITNSDALSVAVDLPSR